MVTADKAPMPRGRYREALRNDEAVLSAAREVFVERPEAKMSDVADRAELGQASLYRRYKSKGELLNAVSFDGMQSIASAAKRALEGGADPWKAFTSFMEHYIESGAAAQLMLAGLFVPDEDLFTLAADLYELTQQVVDRAIAAGALRRDVSSADVPLLAAQICSIRSQNPKRDQELRRRYLALALDGLRPQSSGQLPGAAPDFGELTERWTVQRPSQ